MAKKTYTVTGPLVQARLDDGSYVHLYKGAVLPSNVDDLALESMLASELVAVSDDAPESEPEEMKAGDNPGDFSVAQVKAFLENADEDEKARVLEVETAGKNRSSLTGS